MDSSPRPAKPARLSSGVVVVRHDADTLWLLMLRAFNHWDFPKGMVEAGEEPFAAALREVNEETTIDDLQFPWGHEYIDTGPYSKNKVARYFLGETVTEEVHLLINPELGRAEHAEYRWVGIPDARKLATPRVATVIDWAEARLSEGLKA